MDNFVVFLGHTHKQRADALFVKKTADWVVQYLGCFVCFCKIIVPFFRLIINVESWCDARGG